MRFKAVQVTVVVCLLVLMAVPAFSAPQVATVTVKSDADVAGAVVRLADVADIGGDAMGTWLEHIRSVAICSAPPPAETLLLDANTIASALVAAGVDLSKLKFAGASQSLVHREYDTITVEELSRAFADHVSECTGWPIDSFLVEPPKNLRATPVPLGERKITVETYPHEEFRGSVPVQFQVTVDGELNRILSQRFTIERYAEALVAADKIPRGKSVTSSDVEVVKLEQSRIDGDAFTQSDQAIGLLAARTIPAGKILSPELLTVAPIVRKGEFKSVICSGDGFQILTRGRLLEDGGADDVVRVRLPSRKIVQATVVDSDTLRLMRKGEQHEFR